MAFQQRAMTDEQKETRRQMILAAALALFKASPYDAISMAQVAERAGIAKGTVYLYFKTKEELFLALQTQAFAEWFDEIDAHLAGLAAQPPRCAPDAVVEMLGDSLRGRGALTRLLTLSHSILERNVDVSTAVSFKQFLHARTGRTGAALERCLPFLAAGGGAQLLLWLYALVIGVQAVAEPAPIVKQALAQEPSLEFFQVDFQRALRDLLRTLLDGLAHKERKDDHER